MCEASTASSQTNVPRFKQSFLFLEEDVVKKKSGNQSFWLHGRVTATLISHAIQGELKIDLYSLPASCLLACAALYVYVSYKVVTIYQPCAVPFCTLDEKSLIYFN